MRLHTINNKLYEIDSWFTMIISQRMDDSLWWSSVFTNDFSVPKVLINRMPIRWLIQIVLYSHEMCAYNRNWTVLVWLEPDRTLDRKSWEKIIWLFYHLHWMLVYDNIVVFALRLYLLLLVHQLAHFIDEQRTSEWSAITNECSTRACVWVYICRCHHLRPFHQWIKPLL